MLLMVFAMQFMFAQENAKTLLDTSLNQAKKENKNVLLVFHASWCGWCKLMDKNMNLPETKPMFESSFVTTYVDVQERGEKKKFENPGGQELMNKYKGETAGLPFWVILAPDGKVLADSFDKNGDNLGSPATPEEVTSFIEKLQVASKMKTEDFAVIKKVFIKND